MDRKKRERSINFIPTEVRLLTELVAKYRSVIENKKTDAVINKDKEAAWVKIASLFNASTEHIMRSEKTLKLKYDSIKKETKKKMAKHRQELYRTGGGPSTAPDLDEVEEKILGICSNITGLDARNDSDNIPELKYNSFVEDTYEENLVKSQQQSNTVEFMPLNVIDDNMIVQVVPCDDTDNVLDQDPESGNQNAIEGNKTEKDESEKENKWANWNPKLLKSHVSQSLKPQKKISKAAVTAQLDKLTKARLELVELQMEIARREHKFVEEEHKIKMEHLQNDEKRKQELHKMLMK